MRNRRSAKGKGYARGYSRESSVRYQLWQDGWVVIRCYRSAGGEKGEPVKPIDLCAWRADQKPMFVQVSKLRQWISQDEINELLRLAKKAGTRPILCYRGPKGKFLWEDVDENTRQGEFIPEVKC